MAVQEIIDGLAARLQAQCGQKIVTRGGPRDAFAGIFGGKERRAAGGRGAGVAVILMPQPLQHQGFQIHRAQQALPVTAEFAIALAGMESKREPPPP